MDFLATLFDSSGFVPRRICGEWSTGLILLHNLSDGLIWLSYIAIPFVLVYFIRRRSDMPFPWIFWLFGAFIVLCGTTHVMEVVLFYWPHYRLAGLIKLATAIASVSTVIALVPVTPVALAMRNPRELEREISGRKRVEDALRLANARLELAVRGSNIGIWEFDMPGGEIYKSRANFTNIWEQLGLERPEVPPGFETVIDLVHPDDRERLDRAIQVYLSGKTTQFEVEHRVRREDGSFRWMLTRGVAMRDPSSRPIRFIGSCIDITDHRHAQEALRESEGRFRGTFENAAVGIAHKAADGRFLRINETYCEIVGYTRAELLARTFLDITYVEDLETELEQYLSLMRGELPSYSLEKRYIRKDGSLIWIDVSISLQRDAAGQPAYAIAVLQDTSERKRLEAESRQAREAAEAANRAKDAFLANVSHEIRTPMNAIIGMTELVLDTPMNDDQRQCLETVKSAADNLLAIINDLLDFSKIEAGKLELDPTDFALRPMLGDTLRALAMRAHRKGLELVFKLEPDVPDPLVGDAGRLRQILFNLVDNAIKFTDYGEVVIRVEVAAELAVDGEIGLRFAVSDTGIGIPPEKQETIFRAFEQEDTSTTRRYGGTGLGLTIAARLVALMGGTIAVRSDAGRGSTFTFTARFGRQPHRLESITSHRPAAVLRGLPVLIVDDNATNRHILEEWLRGWQMEPTAVGDGAAAMDALWHSIASGRPYALVLLDACMPGTSGLSLAAMIRERAELSATRIILLTSGDPAGDRARSRELRIDAYLLKPVPQDELLETIYRVMCRAEPSVPTVGRTAVVSAPAEIPLRILVAEDNEFNTRHLERLLARGGHRVRVAGNGREALALLGLEARGSGVGLEKSGIPGERSSAAFPTEDSPPMPNFDVLLLDLHMPELDGFEVVEVIREREQSTKSHLPVIALTARSRREDREHCLAAGMDEYLAKPIRTVDLFAAIDRVVSAHGGARPAPIHDWDRTRLLDPVVLLASCGDDRECLRELCQDFQIYAPVRLAEVCDALRSQNAVRLRETAHKLCGLLSTFSAMAGNLASDLEDHAARGELDQAQPLLERLEPMIHRLVRQVDDLTYESLQQQAASAGDRDRTGGA